MRDSDEVDKAVEFQSMMMFWMNPRQPGFKERFIDGWGIFFDDQARQDETALNLSYDEDEDVD